MLTGGRTRCLGKAAPCANVLSSIPGSSSRLTLIKQSTNDITILSPSNHSVTVDDLNDGTYAVKVALAMAATVKLTVNMDKEMPGTTGELPPVQLTFVQSTPDPKVQSTPGHAEHELPERGAAAGPAASQRRQSVSENA
jgi:hypothetical protein